MIMIMIINDNKMIINENKMIINDPSGTSPEYLVARRRTTTSSTETIAVRELTKSCTYVLLTIIDHCNKNL